MQLNAEAVDPIPALGPDFSSVAFDNLLCDGEAESVAVVHAPCSVQPVEAPENILQIFFAQFFPAVFHRQQRTSALAQKAYFHKFCSLQYSEEELDGYYENPEDGDRLSYAVFFVAANENRTALEARAAAQALRNPSRERPVSR